MIIHKIQCSQFGRNMHYNLFDSQETFLIIINVENNFAASYPWMIFNHDSWPMQRTAKFNAKKKHPKKVNKNYVECILQCSLIHLKMLYYFIYISS